MLYTTFYLGEFMELYDFAYCGDFNEKIKRLKKMIIDENWGKPKNGKDFPVLHNYIAHYFKKIHQDDQIAYAENENGEKIACFNTGLLTSTYNDIYAYFIENKNPNSSQEWFLVEFLLGNSRKLSKIAELPKIATFFNSIDDLFFDTKLELRLNAEHILQDNYERFPDELKQYNNITLVTLLEGAIKIAKKKIERNYKTAVPQFFDNKIQFLIPLCLLDPQKPDIAIAISKDTNYYYGATCLTMDMAYNNARLIVKPESDWLRLSDD